MFAKPIRAGQSSDSSLSEVKYMRRSAYVLQKVTHGFIQNRGMEVLMTILKKKHDYTINVKLSELQCNLYKKYLQCKPVGKRNLLSDCNELKKICSHPSVLPMSEKKDPEKTVTIFFYIRDQNNYWVTQSFHLFFSFTNITGKPRYLVERCVQPQRSTVKY